VNPFLQLFAAKLEMNSSTNVPFWVVAVGCVLLEVTAASGALSCWSLNLAPQQHHWWRHRTMMVIREDHKPNLVMTSSSRHVMRYNLSKLTTSTYLL